MIAPLINLTDGNMGYIKIEQLAIMQVWVVPNNSGVDDSRRDQSSCKYLDNCRLW